MRDVERGVIQRGFRGDAALFRRFRDTLARELPPGTRVALRGSVVTNERWEDGEPFDSQGPATSDIDVALIGDDVMCLWRDDSFYFAGVNTTPLGDDTPDAAPALDDVRRRLQAMVGRPVSFQAMAGWFLELRKALLGQPYLTIIGHERG